MHLDHLYSFIPDIINTKLYASKTIIKKRSPLKCILPINFNNKAVELTRIF